MANGLTRPTREQFRQPVGMFGTGVVNETAFAQALQDYRNAQFEDTFGYPKAYAQQHQQAQEAAQAEWEQLVREMQDAINNVGADPFSQELREYFLGAVGGEQDPFTAAVMAQLASEQTAPIMAGAQQGLSRLRDSFASRGLGRSGKLGSLEQQILQQAIQQAAMARGNVRAYGTQQNAAFRQNAAGQATGFQGQQLGARNALVSQLANLRANRNFDPGYFTVPRNYETAGSDYTYTVPPPVERRRAGTSAPNYTGGALSNLVR